MKEKHLNQSSLIATLGTEPQVVTAALEILWEKGFSINQVRVLHTSQPGKIDQAVDDLRGEFKTYSSYQPVDFTLIPIQDQNRSIIRDVNTEAEIQAAFREIYRQVHHAKEKGQKVHLLIAGGRKTLAIFGMATAQLLLDEEDHLWHLFSEGDFLRSRRMHPTPMDRVSLVEIPIIQWSNLNPIMFDLSEIEDPYEALAIQQDLRLKEKFEKAQVFTNELLTPSEERVVELLVREGLSDAELAERLFLSKKTVNTHLDHARDKASDFWGVERLSRTQLTSLLGYYYASIPEEEDQ